MTRFDFERVKDLLAELHELPPAVRAERLDALAKSEPRLAEEVASLLPLAEQPDTRLTTPGEHRALLDGLLGEPHEAPAGAGAAVTGSTARTSVATVGTQAPGSRVGPYVLGELLGAGGMGQVYEARRERPRRLVALKLLAATAASPAAVRRFRHEVEILGRLDHPGIAALHESGVVETADGARPWFAMQLVRGARLDAWLHARDRSPARIVDLLIRVADAVAHAHARGVVHRDLKPGNLLVTEDDRPKVLDFGVARLTDEHTLLSSLHTSPGQLLGTLPYMSPEQVSGHVEQVGPRSDVYSLGVVLFEALTGRLPIETHGLSVPAAALRIREAAPHLLGGVAPQLAGDLETILDKALAKETSRRYPDAQAFADDLRRHRQRQPVLAQPLSTFGQWLRLVRRHRGLALGVAVAAVALIVATAVSLSHASRSARDRDLALRVADRSLVTAAAMALAADDPASAVDMLDDVSPGGRHWEWAHHRQRLDSLAWKRREDTPILDGTLHRDGTLLLLLEGGRLVRRDMRDGALLDEQQLSDAPGALARLAEDGTRCAGVVGDTLIVWDTALLTEVGRLAIEPPLQDLALDVDGGTVLFEDDRGHASWRPDGGAPPTPIELNRRSYRQAVLAGGRFAVSEPGGRLIVGQLEDPGVRHTLRPDPQRPLAMAFSRDGSLLAIATASNRLLVVDAATGETLRELRGHGRPAHSLHFSVDARVLVTQGQDSTLRLWDVAAGEPLRRIICPQQNSLVVCASPDLGFLVQLNHAGDVTAWDLERLERQELLSGHGSYVYALAFTDAHTLVSAAWDRELRWWDLVAGGLGECTRLPGRPEAILPGQGGPPLVVSGHGIWALSPRTRSVEGVLDDVHPLAAARLDARRVAVLERGGDRGVVQIHDIGSDGPPRAIVTGRGRLTAVAAGDDGRWIATAAAQGQIDLWSVVDGRHLRALPTRSGPVNELAASPDGRWLAAATDAHGTQLIAVHDGSSRQLGGHGGRVHAVAWHPDGSRLATSADDGKVRLFDPSDGALVAQLDGHRDYVRDLAFSPDGRVLASASGDATIRLWHTVPLAERGR